MASRNNDERDSRGWGYKMGAWSGVSQAHPRVLKGRRWSGRRLRAMVKRNGKRGGRDYRLPFEGEVAQDGAFKGGMNTRATIRIIKKWVTMTIHTGSGENL